MRSVNYEIPALKKQIIDKRDQRLFRKIDQCGGKRIVAVVNQWHMEGIEHLWCHAYGQKPRSVFVDADEEIDPGPEKEESL